MPSLRLIPTTSNNVYTNNESNVNKNHKHLDLDLTAPFSPTNAAQSFTRTTTARKLSFKVRIGRDEKEETVHSTTHKGGLETNIRPMPPRPTGGSGCVDLEKVNARLLEILQKEKVQMEREEMKRRIAAKAALKKEEAERRKSLRNAEKVVVRDAATAQDEIGMEIQAEPLPPAAVHRLRAVAKDDVFLPGGYSAHEEGYTLRRQSYPNYSHHHNHDFPHYNPHYHHPTLHLRPAHDSATTTSPPSSTPWWLLSTAAQNRFSFPPLLPRILQASSAAEGQHNNQTSRQPRRGINDRPDWSESDEIGNNNNNNNDTRLRVVSRNSIGSSVGAGLKRLLFSRKSEEEGRSPEGEAKGGRGKKRGGSSENENRMVMRMQNDSVVSSTREAVGWKCAGWF